jgi:hypothetical protein
MTDAAADQRVEQPEEDAEEAVEEDQSLWRSFVFRNENEVMFILTIPSSIDEPEFRYIEPDVVRQFATAMNINLHRRRRTQT